MTELLPDFQLYKKRKHDIKLDAPNDPVLPKGAKLLSIQPAKTLSDEGGDDQSLPPILLGKDSLENDGQREQLVQTWGSPWFPLEFVSQAAKAGHPSQLDACLPVRLKVLSQKFRMVPLLERCRHCIQRTKLWMDRMAALKSDEQALKSNMHKDVKIYYCGGRCCKRSTMKIWALLMSLCVVLLLLGLLPQLDCGLQNSHRQRCLLASCRILPDVKGLKV